MLSDVVSIPQNQGESTPAARNDSGESNRQFQSIPADLRDFKRWVLVRLESRGKGKRTKVPYTPSGRKASSTNPETWSTFSEALRAAPRFDGIGFVFTDTPFFGVDLDHCAPGGVISDEAKIIIDSFASYAEYSFSGDGVHIIGRGATPEGKGFKHGGTEAYSEGRYFTMSGRMVPGSVPTAEERQAVLTDFIACAFPAAAPVPKRVCTPSVPSCLSDRELLDKAMSAKSGAAFAALWGGNTGASGNDHSAADITLCHSLAFWWQADAAAVDRMFRQSGLMRDKWDERRGGETYGEKTIAKALATQSKTYTPPMPPQPRPRPQAPQKPTQAAGQAIPAAALLTGVMAQLAGRLKDSPIRVKPMGAAIGNGATEGDFLKAMRAAMREKDAADTPLQLFLGDLYNQLKLTTPHGGMRSWVLTHFKGNEGVYCNLRKLGCVSAAWPGDLRRQGQSYEFYREGASMSEAWKAETALAIDRGEYKSSTDVKKEKAEIAKQENGEISGNMSAPKGLRADLAGLVADRGEEFAALVLRMARSGALDGFLNCPAPDPKCSASVFTASIGEHLEEAETPFLHREHHPKPAVICSGPEHLECPEDVADAELTEAFVEADYWDAEAQEEQQAGASEADPFAYDAEEAYEPELLRLSEALDLPPSQVKDILSQDVLSQESLWQERLWRKRHPQEARQTRKPSVTDCFRKYGEIRGVKNGDHFDLSPEQIHRDGLLREAWESFHSRARETAFPL